jgi:hypothetical protein
MPIKVVSDPTLLGLTHLRWALTNGHGLSQEVARCVNLEARTINAFVPIDQQLTNFRWGGGGKVSECVDVIATNCQEFLSKGGRIVVFEHHLVNTTDGLGWLGASVRLAEATVFQIASSGTPREELVRLIKLWNSVPIFNAFLSEVGEVQLERISRAPEKSELDLHAIVQGLRTIICGAYDGEGALVWSIASQ